MNISWTEDAWEEYTSWQAENKSILKKINELVRDILRNGNYRILDDELLIYSCARHYND